MTKLRRYAVDFYLSGTVIVKARNREEARRKAASADIATLIDSVENSGFGKYYVDELTTAK
jgi:hypothetical protein